MSARKDAGQMTVELAVLMPVAIVVALISYNLVRFIGLCATFDRVARDAVIAHGVAPSGEQRQEVAVEAVRTSIEDALDAPSCEVDVRAEPAGQGRRQDGGRIGFPISPALTRFTCQLQYRPWPGTVAIAGVSWGAPLRLTHECTLVVDRYRPGVVV